MEIAPAMPFASEIGLAPGPQGCQSCTSGRQAELLQTPLDKVSGNISFSSVHGELICTREQVTGQRTLCHRAVLSESSSELIFPGTGCLWTCPSGSRCSVASTSTWMDGISRWARSEIRHRYIQRQNIIMGFETHSAHQHM